MTFNHYYVSSNLVYPMFSGIGAAIYQSVDRVTSNHTMSIQVRLAVYKRVILWIRGNSPDRGNPLDRGAYINLNFYLN